jgi:hypothetical protein
LHATYYLPDLDRGSLVVFNPSDKHLALEDATVFEARGSKKWSKAIWMRPCGMICRWLEEALLSLMFFYPRLQAACLCHSSRICMLRVFESWPSGLRACTGQLPDELTLPGGSLAVISAPLSERIST